MNKLLALFLFVAASAYGAVSVIYPGTVVAGGFVGDGSGITNATLGLPTNLTISNLIGGSLVSDGSVSSWFTPRNKMVKYDEFLSSSGPLVIGDLNWNVITNTAGTCRILDSGPVGHTGVGVLELPNSGTGYSVMRLGGGNSMMRFGSGRTVMAFLVQSVNAPDSADDDFSIRVGCNSVSTGQAGNTGLNFVLNANTNSSKWAFYAASNGSRTGLNSSAGFTAGAWYLLSFDVDASGASVTPYINGVSMGTITNNIPTSFWSSPMVSIARNAGGAPSLQDLYIDYFWWYREFTTQR